MAGSKQAQTRTGPSRPKAAPRAGLHLPKASVANLPSVLVSFHRGFPSVLRVPSSYERRVCYACQALIAEEKGQPLVLREG